MACYSMVRTMTMAIILKCNKKVNWSGETGWPPNGSTSQLVWQASQSASSNSYSYWQFILLHVCAMCDKI